ncbi:hypothetical protein BV25DRAFT_1828097, partial [Artomyces pyxidatus]
MPLFPASPPAPFPPSHIAYLPTHRGWRYQMLTLTAIVRLQYSIPTRAGPFRFRVPPFVR